MDYQFMDEQLTLFSVEEFVFQDVLEFREDEISLKPYLFPTSIVCSCSLEFAREKYFPSPDFFLQNR